MSSSDIFDVLNIKQKSKSPIHGSSPLPSAGSSTNLTPTGSRVSKPQVTGMQRELYNLLGDNQPPVMVQPSSKFKEKLTSKAKPSPWTYAEFKPSGKNNIRLRHWVKGSKDLLGPEPQESDFAKFSVRLSLPEFTEEEYELFMKSGETKNTEKEANANKLDLQDNAEKPPMSNVSERESNVEDEKEKNKEESAVEESGTENGEVGNSGKVEAEEWTYEEVAYLFTLCREYDLRWFVIDDRYLFDGKSRPLEDLKAKFYEVSKKYFKFKDNSDVKLESLNFSKDKELERKKYLQRLLSRSAAEIAEEEALIIESRKFEMAAKKTLSEREALLRLLDSPISTQNVSQYLSSQGISQLYNNLLSDRTRKRKNDNGVPENPWMKQQQHFAQQRQQLQQTQERKNIETHSQDGQASPRKTKKQKQELQTAMKRKSEAAYAETLLKDFSAEERKALGVVTHGEKLSPGVYLRSTRIPTYKPALQNRVVATLHELGLPVRPAMPSFEVVQRQEELLKKIVTLLDMKKHIDKLEAEKSITK
ncbi:hypothetical protein KAFR_0F03300 [Kazachstania africana CBS 2517]|uniref:SWR1-complex protein 4 n=1 Tax=Kazachstania africana (strain ATCC 22294 / BCRC 22015 / CBS 2517 / CECT 1963 / NBRC 1671 / NRRL Y-8276) TaxID=1071382 RepID=H2AX26_KAZAF|nr:hypothetical protein KAFR_0F03300 [Kazachstania africana CBS 2517]CCF58926.1 hypothetical protein KAFR_0F03300 [Kazachstania africana CBS 2517]